MTSLSLLFCLMAVSEDPAEMTAESLEGAGSCSPHL